MRTIITPLLLSVSLCLTPILVNAQMGQDSGRRAIVGETTPDALSPFRQFDTAFETLTRQGDITIVCESSPMTPTLTDDAYKALGTVLQQANISRDEVITAVADAFDYEVIHQRANLYLLKKRYRLVNELPFVTLEEMSHALDVIQRMAIPLGGNGKRFTDPTAPPIAHQVLLSLSPAEIERFRLGIPVKSLSPQVQTLVRQYALSNYGLSYLDQLALVQYYLRTFHRPDAVYRYFDLFDTGIQVFGFEGPFLFNSVTRKPTFLQYGLSHGFRNQITGAGATATRDGYSIVESTMAPPADPVLAAEVRKRVMGHLDDPDTPVPGEVATEPNCPTTLTLKQCIDQLNQREGKGIRFEVDDILGPKPVTLFGPDAQTPEGILKAVSSLYGLRIVRTKEGRQRLTTPAIPRVKDVSEFRNAIRNLTPEPILRLWQGAQYREENRILSLPGRKKRDLSRVKPEKRSGLEQFEKKQLAIAATTRAEEIVYRTTAHRLRVLLEPKVTAHPDKRLPMDNMNADESRLFMLLCFLDYSAITIADHDPPVPHVLQDFDSAWIIGTWNEPKGVWSLHAAYRDAKGTFVSEGGAVYGNILPPDVAANAPSSPVEKNP